jgi:hypothetical protein
MKDLEWYLVEIVDPTFKEFADNPTSRRHAFLACAVACHAVDYLAYPNDPRTLRQQFGHQSPAFKIVNDVGHAFKHVVQGQASNPRMRQSEVISRPPGNWDVAVWDLSHFDDPIGGVTLDTNRNIDLLETAKTAVSFLWSKVKAMEQPAQPSPSA